MQDLPDLKDLPADRWIYLERPRYCTNCSKEIEADKRVLYFPFTRSAYCHQCARLFTGRLEDGGRRYAKEYMAPPGKE